MENDQPQTNNQPQTGWLQAAIEAGNANVEQDYVVDPNDDPANQMGEPSGPPQSTEPAEPEGETKPDENDQNETKTEPESKPAESATETPEVDPRDAEIERLRAANQQLAESRNLESQYYTEDLRALQDAFPEGTTKEIMEQHGLEEREDALEVQSRQRANIEKQAKLSSELRATKESESLQVKIAIPRLNEKSADYDSGIADQMNDLYERVAGVETVKSDDGRDVAIKRVNVMPRDFMERLDKLVASAEVRGETRAAAKASSGAAGAASTPKPGTDAKPKANPNQDNRPKDAQGNPTVLSKTMEAAYLGQLN